MATLKVKGLDELEKALKDGATLNDVKKTVKFYGGKLHDQMVENADFRGHYEWKKGQGKVFVPPTGTTKDIPAPDKKDGGLTVVVEPATEYSPYLEYGTRFMDAQPFVKPAHDAVKGQFKTAIKKLMR